MKLPKITYWTSTILFCVWMIKNAYTYLAVPEAGILCAHLGFPDYFRIELALCKAVGVIVLLLPLKSTNIREWAYAGFAITMVSGFIAHLGSGDALLPSLSALVALALLIASYTTYEKVRN